MAPDRPKKPKVHYADYPALRRAAMRGAIAVADGRRKQEQFCRWVDQARVSGRLVDRETVEWALLVVESLGHIKSRSDPPETPAAARVREDAAAQTSTSGTFLVMRRPEIVTACLTSTYK